MKYNVRLRKDGIHWGYLQHRDKTSWCKKVAKKHAKYMIEQGYEVILEESWF
jgi:hypothetical protein